LPTAQNNGGNGPRISSVWANRGQRSKSRSFYRRS